MNYFLIGYYGYGNCGDTACLFKTKKLISTVNQTVQFKTLYAHHTTDEEYVYRWSFMAIIKAIFWSDYVVFGGGSILQNATSYLSLYYYLMIIVIAAIARRKVILLGQGIGPVNGMINFWVMSLVLKLVHRITVRDQFTYSLLSHSQQTATVLSSDITFYNEHRIRYHSYENGHVGVSFRPSQLSSYYLNMLHEAILAQSSKISYFAFHPEQDMKVYNQCSIVASSVTQITDYYNQSSISAVKVMVVMRYHAAIWAALRGIPFLALSYDPKVDSIAHFLGQEVISIQDAGFDSTVFHDVFESINESWDDYHASLIEKTRLLMSLSKKHEEVFM